MKTKILRGITVLTLCVVFQATAQIQYVTLKSGNFAVQTNQIITLVGYDWITRPTITGYFPDGTPTRISPYTIYNPTYASSVTSAYAAPSFYNSSPLATQIFTGLTNISVSAVSATFKIETLTTQSYLPANAVVIPTDATGPVQIILESSADLVNWTGALPGTYGTFSTNRFFRVRAVASP